MEFLQYVSGFLSYPSSFTGYPLDAFEKDGDTAFLTVLLSRDRKSQIKRTICFPELTSLMEIVNTYPTRLQQEEPALASPFEERIDAKQMITAYLHGDGGPDTDTRNSTQYAHRTERGSEPDAVFPPEFRKTGRCPAVLRHGAAGECGIRDVLSAAAVEP